MRGLAIPAASQAKLEHPNAAFLPLHTASSPAGPFVVLLGHIVTRRMPHPMLPEIYRISYGRRALSAVGGSEGVEVALALVDREDLIRLLDAADAENPAGTLKDKDWYRRVSAVMEMVANGMDGPLAYQMVREEFGGEAGGLSESLVSSTVL